MLRNYQILTRGLIFSLLISYLFFYPKYLYSYNLKHPLLFASTVFIGAIICFIISYKIHLATWLFISLVLLNFGLIWQNNILSFSLSIGLISCLLANSLRREGLVSFRLLIINLFLGIALSYLCYQSADFLSLELIILSILLIKILLNNKNQINQE